MNETIWIIGASHGIGAALARHPALRGKRLIVSGRSREALTALVQESGGEALPLDVTDADAVARAAAAVFTGAMGRVRVWHMAAAYEPMPLRMLDLEAARQMLEVNLWGALTVVKATLPHFAQRGEGQLALCASVAGWRGLPGGQPYSATKAALINLAESLKVEEPWLDVRLLSPGFVKTRLTDRNAFPMPFLLTPEAAAARIVPGLLSGTRFEIHFPRRLTWGLAVLRCLPMGIYAKLVGRMGKN
jgi:NAD(P)-dependent dehydrogenase (short-subunit alcohol dehydrogenase family)